MSYCAINLQRLELQPITVTYPFSFIPMEGGCFILVPLSLPYIMLSISLVSCKSDSFS